MTSKCKAWVMTEPGKLVMKEFDIPVVADDCALLKIETCGICGTDKHAYLGHLPTAQFPFIAGHEFIGTIVELGSKANDNMTVFGGPLKEGDRVTVSPSTTPCGQCYYCVRKPHRPYFCLNRSNYGFMSTECSPSLWGGFSEYVYLHPRSYVFHMPEDMPLKRAVLVEPLATALKVVERACRAGDSFTGYGYGAERSAMVLGAGPIGLMVVASLRNSGAGLIIVQDILPGKLDMAKKLGADILIDGNLPLDKRLTQVREATDGFGPDIVIEATGVPVVFREALDFTSRGGKLVIVGLFADTGAIDIHPAQICRNELDILGSYVYPSVMFQDAISLLKRTPLLVEEIVTHVLPLSELPSGIELSGSEGVGKIVINPWM